MGLDVALHVPNTLRLTGENIQVATGTRKAMTAIRRICKEHDVACGHPHVDAGNAQRVIDEGYRFLVAAPVRSYAGLEACRRLTGNTSV